MSSKTIYALYSKRLLWAAGLTHVVSYFVPMNFRRILGPWENPWGEIVWEQFLSNPLEGWRWELEWYLMLGVLLPLVTLPLIVGWNYRQRHHWRKLPPTWVSALALLGGSWIIPVLFVFYWWVQGRAESLMGYFVWNASYWLFFFGFFYYKKALQASEEQHLSDHLIDEDL